MNRQIIHGENTMLSREALGNAKKGFEPSEVFVYQPGKVNFLEVPMFSQPKIIVVEFFEKSQVKEFSFESFAASFDGGLGSDVVLWFNFELTATNKILTQAKAHKFVECKFGVSPFVFKLVDAFFSGKRGRANFYNLLADTQNRKSDEVFLIQMLIRNLRLILWASFNNESYKGLSGFLKRQAALGNGIPKSRLPDLFDRFVGLETKIKTGFTDLTSEILLLYESL